VPAITSSTITAFYLFDVAEQIDLAGLRTAIGGGATPARLTTKSAAPSYLQYSTPPVVVDGEALDISEIDGFRLRVKFFDYGVLSLALTRRFAGDWSEFIGLSQIYLENEALEQQAETIARRISERFASAMTAGRAKFLTEDYLVFAVTSFSTPITAEDLIARRSEDIARLLRGERQPLSRQERDDIINNRLSYLADDLVVPTWNAAFVYDTEPGAQAALEIVEFANSQLLEFRYYDELLDLELGNIYAQLDDLRQAKAGQPPAPRPRYNPPRVTRVRFAPSPTGYLHIGGARTALFNWLYARRHGGTFVLRIEDTDAERSSWDMVAGIVDGLRWLGLDWDEGPDIGGPHAPYFQSGRLDKYRAMAESLVKEALAYYCYCSPATIQQKRQAAEVAGGGWMYDRACAALTAQQIAELEASGAPGAIRFRVPPGQTGFDDRVRGTIAFDNSNIEDFVVLRSDRQPTYHLSVVVDDIDMEITDVVRGDDHISNTPKQVLLYNAFGRQAPRFAHVPLILGPDKKRLSKRHGATSVMEYHRLGYLPEAMVNFLALLGWSPGTDQELFTREDLIARFTLEGISGGNAVFNPEKLDWFNQQHILRLAPEELARRVQPLLEQAGLWRDSFATSERGWFLRVLDLLKPRVRKLSQFVDDGRPFFEEAVVFDDAAVRQHLTVPGMRSHLHALASRFAMAQPFDQSNLETVLRGAADERGLKPAALIHATRVAATGRGASPGLFEVLELLGQERTVSRLGRAASLASE